MRQFWFMVLLLAIGVLVFLVGPGQADEPLQVGLAVVDITPPVGYRMAGYFSERLSTGTHDPLLAKAIVVYQGRPVAAFVECDLVGIPASVPQRLAHMAEFKTLDPAFVIIAATHSHTGPLYYGSLRNRWHKQAIARFGKDPAEEFDNPRRVFRDEEVRDPAASLMKIDYPEALAYRLAQAIDQAAKNVRPVTVKCGVGEETRLSFNRRFHMKDGTVRFNPGRQNPDIVRPAGPIDPDVGIVLFSDAANGKPIAALTNFALHLDTVGGTEYSADYPYYLEQKLRDRLGNDFVSLFATGTCGDINHIDVSRPDQLKGQPEAERIGTALGETVLATLPNLVEQTDLFARAGGVEFRVPAQQFSAEQIKAAAENMAKIGTRELSFLEQVETNKITDIVERYNEGSVPIRVQAIRLSPDLAIVALPGEVFVELGLAIKLASPFKTTLVVELCNDSPAYIPTKKAFVEGSYEIVNSRIEAGGGEQMVDRAVELLNRLKAIDK